MDTMDYPPEFRMTEFRITEFRKQLFSEYRNSEFLGFHTEFRIWEIVYKESLPTDN